VTNNRTRSGGAEKVPPSAQKLVEMIERLQRDVTESSAKTDWHLAFEESLEKEISSLRADLARITQRGNTEWQREARSWFEVHADLLATKVEEMSNASEARLRSRAQQASRAVEERADDAAEQARTAAAELAQAASEQRLARAERQLAKVFESAKADLDRQLSETIDRRLAEIERSAERHATAAARELGQRLGALRKEVDARLAAATKQRVAAAEKSVREAAERGIRKREETARRAENGLSDARDRLVAQLEAESERLADAAATRLGGHAEQLEAKTTARAREREHRAREAEKTLAQAHEKLLSDLEAKAEHAEGLLDRVADAETQARERLLALAEELAAEIVVAEQAQQREREVRSEARKVAAGLEELRNVSKRASRRRGLATLEPVVKDD
jgi:hypothetical protein